ncbi:helix-turn-helix domain-containing protein [Marasmitruncus massiliensis]|uniref:helix-turn-helix domain-containing protein n=1 Tax=Marasmitruncus massiliensis TaxID=1944642 RepID=UPI000C7B7E40|nr:helix-turn-helix domain-containing protein [Marasmitruncus massiliensis]
MNYFSIGNKLFSFGLSPAEAIVFCAVRSFRNPLSFAVCCANTISNKTGLSVRTIYRALEDLQNKDLLCKAKRYRYDGSRAANGYHVARVGGGQFKVERNIWKYKLDAASFLVYLYITKCINNHSREGFPSLRKMEKVLGLSRTTIIAKIRELHRLGVLRKYHQRHKQGYHCNRHCVPLLNYKPHIAKQKGRTAMRPFLMRHPAFALTTRRIARIPSICSVAHLDENFKRAKKKRRCKLFSYFRWFRFGRAGIIPISVTAKERIALDST